MNFIIDKTKYTVKPDGTGDVVTFIFWSATKTDQSVTANIVNRGTPVTEDPLASKPYETVTEQDCIDYLNAHEDLAGIEAQLDALIANIETPTVGVGRPWQDEFPLWAINVAYAVDDVAIYQNIGYQVIQAHTSQSQWAPPVTPALWKVYVPPSEGPQPWVQPTGSQDAYPIGSQVTHDYQGQGVHLYTSLVDANVWEPGTDPGLWQDEGPY